MCRLPRVILVLLAVLTGCTDGSAGAAKAPAKHVDAAPADAAPVDATPGASVLADPFGSPEGWAERARDGEAWAVEVMTALNRMEVEFSGAEGQVAEFKFDVEICPDGRLVSSQKKGTGDVDLDRRIERSIGDLRVTVPKDVLALLAGECRKIQYEFTWSSRGPGRSKVR